MDYVFVVIGLLLVIVLLSINGALTRLAIHHEKFEAPGEQPTIVPGQEIWIRAFGQDAKCQVLEMAPDGAILVQPLNVATGEPLPQPQP